VNHLPIIVISAVNNNVFGLKQDELYSLLIFLKHTFGTNKTKTG